MMMHGSNDTPYRNFAHLLPSKRHDVDSHKDLSLLLALSEHISYITT